jgi:hypothetical protein
MSKARNLSDFISDPTISTTEIADLAVTHAKLHGTMDLSSKTVTLPTLSSLTVQGTVAATAVTGDGSGLTGLPAGVGGANGVTFNDNVKAQFGAGNDLQIYHNGGSGNYIDSVNKDLYIRCNLDAGIVGGDIVLQPKSGENSAVFRDNGAVELYYDNALKLATTSTGIDVTGTVAAVQLDITEGTDARLKSSIAIGEVGSGIFALQTTNTAGSALRPLGFRADDIRFATGSSERMRIDSSGNVGIGTTTPSNYYSDNLVINGGSEGGITIVGASTHTNYIMFADGTTGNERYRGYLAYNHPGDYLTIASSGSERIRVDTSGNFLVGKLNGSLASSNTGVVLNPNGVSSINSASDTNMIFARAGTGTMIVFRANNVTTTGTISVSGSSTAYNTSSDYRLKENVVDLTGASARVNQLNPSRFNWIADETNTLVDGFLAHEVADVVPEAINGTHNEVEVWKDNEELPDGVSAGDNKLDDDGNTIPVYQGIDQSKLVPLLTAALQEALAEIASLKTRVEALE